MYILHSIRYHLIRMNFKQIYSTHMLRSHIHEYYQVRNVHFTNGHRMLITIEHMNLEIWKHVTTSCSGTKPFYQLRVKGLDVRKRDTIFYAVLFIWPPTRAAPSSKIDPSRLASSTRLFLSSNFHINLRALPVRDVTRTLSPSIVFDYYDIWVTPPSARARPR